MGVDDHGLPILPKPFTCASHLVNNFNLKTVMLKAFTMKDPLIKDVHFELARDEQGRLYNAGMRKLLGRQCIDGYSRGGDPELLKTPSPEELVVKERNDNGGYSRPQSGSCRTRAAMVHSKASAIILPMLDVPGCLENQRLPNAVAVVMALNTTARVSVDCR